MSRAMVTARITTPATTTKHTTYGFRNLEVDGTRAGLKTRENYQRLILSLREAIISVLVKVFCLPMSFSLNIALFIGNNVIFDQNIILEMNLN